MKHNDILSRSCIDLGLNLNETQYEQFEDYYRLLIEKNKVMNLTAITDYEEVMIKHFVDSLYVIKYIDFHQFHNVIDIGTGAGFPGIPLKIVYPEIKICLLDSLNKRVQFLNEVISILGLQGITTVSGRAEDLAHKHEYREQFDCCVSRAVANLSTLTEYCTPFIKCNGIFISYKSDTIEEEIEKASYCLKTLNCEIEAVEKYLILDTDIKRSLLFIRKMNHTNKKYPRKAGTPSRKPL